MNSIKRHSERLKFNAHVAATMIVALCCGTSAASGAEPASTPVVISAPTASAKRAPADWGTTRKLQWQSVRNGASEKSGPVRSVKYEEDVFADGPALDGKAKLASAPMGVAQNPPRLPFDEPEPPKATTPPPTPMPEPLPQPTLPTDTTPTPVPTPMPAPTDSTPPDFGPPSTTPTPTPTPDPLLDGPRTPATNPPDIFLPQPSSDFESNFPHRDRTALNPALDCENAYSKLKKNTIDKLSIDIHVSGKPGDDVPFECSLTEQSFDPRCWRLTTYTWKASCLCHKPIYFEEEALERYGHSHGCGCEYLVSFAHFFGNVALLPYHMGVQTPCECIYDLGVYRPGSCAPYMIDPFPISLRGAAFGAIGYCGTVALFP